MRSIKKHISNTIVFGVVTICINIGISAMLPKYKSDSVIANNGVKLAYVRVPVPFEPMAEGAKMEYTISCSVKKQALECNL